MLTLGSSYLLIDSAAAPFSDFSIAASFSLRSKMSFVNVSDYPTDTK